MQVVLVMFRSDGERRSFSVVRNMTVIGRREDCDLRIPVGDVSRKHCRLVRTDDGIRIEDLGSSNGTLVNGRRVQESELNAGDQVGIGPVQFIVQIDGVPDDDQISAPAPATINGSEDTGEALSLDAEYAELEELPLEEISAEEESPLEEITSDQVTIDEAPLEEESLEEVPATKPMARRPPPPLPVPPPMIAEEPIVEEVPLEVAPLANAGSEIEHVDLEEAEPATHEAAEAGEEADPLATTAAPAAEGDWDFTIEDNEGERSHADFQIDLDSPHEQPHK